MKNYKTVSLVLGVVLLLSATAGATVYLSKQPATAERPAPIAERVSASDEQPPPLPAAGDCNDGNIAGKVVGGVGGGVIGSMAGKGSGKTAATIGGTLGGAYLGGEVLPLNNVTCP